MGGSRRLRQAAAAAVCVGAGWALASGGAESRSGLSAPPVWTPSDGDSAQWHGVAALRPGSSPFGLIGDAAIGSGGTTFVLDVMERRVGMAVAGDTVAWTGRPGQGPGEFFIPVAVAVDDDAVYVLDRGNQRIEQFRTTQGGLERTGSLSLAFAPEDLCTSTGRLFVLGAHRGFAIHEVSPRTGRVLRSFAPDAELAADLLATFRAGGYLACPPDGGHIAFLPLLRAEVRLFSAHTGELLETAPIPGYHAVLIRKTADAVQFRAPEGGTHDMAASVVPLADGRMVVQTGAVRPGATTIHEFTSIQSYVVDWEHGTVRPLAGRLPRITAVHDSLALALETDPHPRVRRIRLTFPPAPPP